MVFTVSSKAQSSWLFEVTAILKAQSTVFCRIKHGIHEVTPSASSGPSTKIGDFGAELII